MTNRKNEKNIELTTKEVAEIRNQLKQMRSWRRNPAFEFRDKNLEIEIVYKDLVRIIVGNCTDQLRCSNCTGSCDEALKDGNLLICPKLSKALGVLKEETKIQQVEGYTYKYLPNQSQRYYWYIQFTEYLNILEGDKPKKIGKSKSVYLGKDQPSFRPKEDLEKAKSRTK